MARMFLVSEDAFEIICKLPLEYDILVTIILSKKKKRT